MNSPPQTPDEFDAMAPRNLTARWVLTARLVSKTATHFGGQAESALDMPILRCARTSRPLLPGSTLGGALRAYLLDRLAGYGIDADEEARAETLDRSEVARVFGGSRSDDEGSQSPLIVFDALGSLPDEFSRTEIRDGVLIETATGTAAAHKKFDFEVIPPGTAFDVRFDVLVPTPDNEQELLSAVVTALAGLDDSEIHIGLRRSRGLGEVATSNWSAQRYDLASREGWLDWIASDHERPADHASAQTARQAIESAAPSNASVQLKEDRRSRVIVEIEAAVVGELLIRSPNDSASGPDVMHLSSGSNPVLSGTSLTGSIRAHALKIVQLVHAISRDEAESHYVSPLFGAREEKTRNPEFKPWGSRLHVTEQSVQGGTDPHVTRIAIDRFTQGVISSALFDEKPHARGTVKVRFEIRNPRTGEIGLLLLVLKDLLTGRLTVGGSSSVGRGVLRGKRVVLNGSEVPGPIMLEFEGGQPSGHEFVDKQIHAFVNSPKHEPREAGVN